VCIPAWKTVGEEVIRRTVKVRRESDCFRRIDEAPFPVDEFLRQPLVARVATGDLVVRPFWFLWEDETFWIFTGTWSRLISRLRADPRFELVVDTCEIHTGVTRQVIARGDGSIVDLDANRARRKLVRYLGAEESRWDSRFRISSDPACEDMWLAKLVPHTLWISDQSFNPSASG
jgi:Pyridoxamine 5'-phosphate oxidase